MASFTTTQTTLNATFVSNNRQQRLAIPIPQGLNAVERQRFLDAQRLRVGQLEGTQVVGGAVRALNTSIRTSVQSINQRRQDANKEIQQRQAAEEAARTAVTTQAQAVPTPGITRFRGKIPSIQEQAQIRRAQLTPDIRDDVKTIDRVTEIKEPEGRAETRVLRAATPPTIGVSRQESRVLREAQPTPQPLSLLQLGQITGGIPSIQEQQEIAQFERLEREAQATQAREQLEAATGPVSFRRAFEQTALGRGLVTERRILGSRIIELSSEAIIPRGTDRVFVRTDKGVREIKGAERFGIVLGDIAQFRLETTVISTAIGAAGRKLIKVTETTGPLRAQITAISAKGPEVRTIVQATGQTRRTIELGLRGTRLSRTFTVIKPLEVGLEVTSTRTGITAVIPDIGKVEETFSQFRGIVQTGKARRTIGRTTSGITEFIDVPQVITRTKEGAVTFFETEILKKRVGIGVSERIQLSRVFKDPEITRTATQIIEVKAIGQAPVRVQELGGFRVPTQAPVKTIFGEKAITTRGVFQTFEEGGGVLRGEFRTLTLGIDQAERLVRAPKILKAPVVEAPKLISQQALTGGLKAKALPGRIDIAAPGVQSITKAVQQTRTTIQPTGAIRAGVGAITRTAPPKTTQARVLPPTTIQKRISAQIPIQRERIISRQIPARAIRTQQRVSQIISGRVGVRGAQLQQREIIRERKLQTGRIQAPKVIQEQRKIVGTILTSRVLKAEKVRADTVIGLQRGFITARALRPGLGRGIRPFFGAGIPGPGFQLTGRPTRRRAQIPLTPTKRRFIPSLTALAFDITAEKQPKPRAGRFTGLEIRPLILSERLSKSNIIGFLR